MFEKDNELYKNNIEIDYRNEQFNEDNIFTASSEMIIRL